ncbi:MAG: response regulator [Candidatus Omnitrophota bacterium]|nr:response regulator [Candidatus Omnitrophota bacterium]MDZ4243038.1 response regulator [Candidatus Omnitrophota bacterium]
MTIPKVIMIVDDDQSLVGLMKYQLEAQGHTVVTAPDGQEGLEKLKSVQPDLIILDIHMPRMSGLEFFKNIITGYGHVRYPVLILTSKAEFEAIFQDMGAAGFVAKPFLVEHLLSETGRILAKFHRPAVLLVELAENIHSPKIAEALEKEQYQVVFLRSIQQLKDAVPQPLPRFILMEFMQKGISGDELIRAFKGHPALKDIPVIVYSYSGIVDCKGASLKAGAAKYVDDPRHYEELVRAIREIEINPKR